jgi:hypothetical protein
MHHFSVPRVEAETREDRALDLYAGLGRSIEETSPGTFSVPSQDGRRIHKVTYGGAVEESCTCSDHRIRGESCVHLLAVGIHHAARRRRRTHTFECNGCQVRHPLREAVVVFAEILAFAHGVREGEMLCAACARQHGAA